MIGTKTMIGTSVVTSKVDKKTHRANGPTSGPVWLVYVNLLCAEGICFAAKPNVQGFCRKNQTACRSSNRVLIFSNSAILLPLRE